MENLLKKLETQCKRGLIQGKVLNMFPPDKIEGLDLEKSPQRVEFKNSRGLNLVGELRVGDKKSIVILVSGLLIDRHENGRFDILADKLNKKGYSILSFDFTGRGESEGEISKPSEEIDDLISAIKFAKEKGFASVAIIGSSFGGYIASRAYPLIPNIETMVLWAPVSNKKDNPSGFIFPEQQKELSETGRMKVRGGVKDFVLDREFFDIWSRLDQKELIGKIKCPVLIIHGDADETVSPDDSKKAMQYLSSDSKLELVQNAGHGGKMGEEGIAKFIELTNSWLNLHLSE